jgi:putative flippase GtrA
MLPRTRSPITQPADAEPTLGAVLTHFARTAVPSRLYKLLQFGIPFALDFGLHGYWHAAAWGVAVSSLGAWGLADRWLFTAPAREGRRATLMRYARVVSGALAAGVAGLLLLELFLRLLGNAPIS